MTACTLVWWDNLPLWRERVRAITYTTTPPVTVSQVWHRRIEPSPSPTVTRTPAPSASPTISHTSSISETPTASESPAPSPTKTAVKSPTPSASGVVEVRPANFASLPAHVLSVPVESLLRYVVEGEQIVLPSVLVELLQSC